NIIVYDGNFCFITFLFVTRFQLTFFTPIIIIKKLNNKSCDGDSRPAGTFQRAGEGGIPVQVAQN
ncbi:hypothetical protein, partial [Enterocloster citroniae]|uniref:hypothetical protein n=1 Tax=Enterocloster citroniae TaxID=358743 RepID=UPI0030411891|nr:hypothetical protein [Enterocloster citroniae]